MSVTVSIIVPAYNETENLSVLRTAIANQLSNTSYEVIFIDDGSQDNTLYVIKQLAEEYEEVHYLSFARNFGHQAAVRAGIEHAKGDCVISMDADMQHPPELIPTMFEKWREGFEVVYTLREKDRSLSKFKQITSKVFYKLMSFLSPVKLEDGAADFRLLDKAVVEVLKDMPEQDMFLRGIIPWLGFKQFAIPYTPAQRLSGTTKYSFKKMMKLALSGITAFSARPLQLATLLGFTFSGVAFLYIIYAMFVYFFSGEAISGWASILISVLLIGGIQLIVLGIIGAYLGRLFLEHKQRPHYIIREKKL